MKHTQEKVATTTASQPEISTQSQVAVWFKDLPSDTAVKAWDLYGRLLEETEHAQWLDAAGGLAMESVETDIDLLIMANTAPSALLFGLAYGKFQDGLVHSPRMRTPAYPVVYQVGTRSRAFTYIESLVMDRVASEQERVEQSASSTAPGTHDLNEAVFHLMARSRETPINSLLRNAGAPGQGLDAFLLGQATSWLITAHRLANADRFDHVLEANRTPVNDIDLQRILSQALSRDLPAVKPPELATSNV